MNVGELLERLGIQAEQRGSSWWACCPFHDEKTPSWRMRDEFGSERHGKHHCFGCEEGGSAVYLVMRLLGLEAREAWLWIKSNETAAAHLKLSVSVSVKDRAREFRLPFGVETGIKLGDWPMRPREYAHKRNIWPEQVERWGIGFAREGRLRGRIVIPIYAQGDLTVEPFHGRGKLLSYTARAWGRNVERKYFEPREEENADKAAIFGEEKWHGERGTVFVFEGALNALAAERALYQIFEGRIGALHGSNFHPGHAAKLATFDEVVIAADPDKAGNKMRAAIAGGLARWSKVRHVVFPEGRDACDVERECGLPELARLLLP